MPLVVLRLWPLCVKYCGCCGCYDQSVFDRVFKVFLPIKATHSLYRFFKEIKSLWWLILFFIDIGHIDCSVDCTVDCTEDSFVGCTADCSLLRNISSFLFFIGAASLWP